MRYRFLSLAVLAGVALALLAPAQPAAADDSCPAGYDCVDCSREIVFDPSFCMYPPEPPPPPQQTMSPMGPGAPVPPSPLPGMMPTLPGEECSPEETFSSQAGISETGKQDKLVYTFVVKVSFCIQNGIVTKTRILSFRPEQLPRDPRINDISDVMTSTRGTTGGPTFLQVEDVFTEFCADRVNCELFRHIFVIEIDARRAVPLDVDPLLFRCNNPACT